MSNALAVVELSPQEQEFAHLLATKGMSPPDAGRQVGISRSTAYIWAHKPSIVEYVNTQLARNRTRVQTKASALIDDAFDLLSNALTNPMVTPSQVKAAQLILQHAIGSDRVAAEGGNITVEVHTTLGSDILAQQQARQQRVVVLPAVQGDFTELPDDE